MTTEALKSTSITNLDTTPPLASTTGEGAAGVLRSLNAYMTPSASMAALSTYQFVRIPTNAKVKHIYLESAAQGAGKVNVGLYYSTSTKDGTPVDKQGTVVASASALYATDVDLASAVAMTDITNESGSYTVDKRNQPAWQAAGLTSDPGGYFDVVATVHTTDITTGTGKIGIEVQFVM